jgi:hypothetical protein
MKISLFVLSLVTAAAAFALPAQAQNYPWCAYYGGARGGGGENCGFSTFSQCEADISGIGGYCAHNTQFHGRLGPR